MSGPPSSKRRSARRPGPAAPPEGGGPGPLALGSTGRTHPPIGLGLWALGRWEPEDEAATARVLDRGLERGIGWIDTAEVYGQGRSERLLGETLARRPAGSPRPFLTTKLSWEHLRAPAVRPALLGSLRRLGLRSVDLYLVHAPDARVPIGETMGALEALWKEGLIGAIGVSNFTLDQLEAASAALKEAEIVANQVRFNLFERDEADPILPYCRAHRIVVEAYSPTARGLLAGRYLTGRERPAGPGRRRLFGADRFPEERARALRLKELADGAGVPMLALALHALRRAGAAPVFGASRPEQVDDVLAAWAARPSERLLDRAEGVARGDAD